MKTNDTIHLKIGDEAKRDLRILAAHMGVTMTEMVRELIREAKLEQEGKRGEESDNENQN